MTKESKARMIAHLVGELLFLDEMISLNEGNIEAVKSLTEQYRAHAKRLAELRDAPTSN